jgi:hypothetical protein
MQTGQFGTDTGRERRGMERESDVNSLAVIKKAFEQQSKDGQSSEASDVVRYLL